MLFQRMLIADGVEERDKDVKSGAQYAAVFPQPLDYIGALLRNHDRGLGDDG